MNTIVNEKLIAFKDLDKDIHPYRDKGYRQTTIKTIYGDVTYQRHVYQTKVEEGQTAYIYLLDESVGMEKIGLISSNMVEKIVNCVTENSYRVTAETITETC